MRNGKIAKLPGCVRRELNERMDNGESGTAILEWLNGVPRVQEIITASFDGVPITKQNLSEWRQGGFREWEIRQELYSEAGESLDVRDHIDMPLLAGNLLAIVMARYAGLMNRWDGGEDPQFEARVRVLRGLLRDITLAQRSVEREHKEKSESKAQNEAAKAVKGGLGTSAKSSPGIGAGSLAGKLVEEALAGKVVTLPGTKAGAGSPTASNPVAPGQGQSHQKVSFDAIGSVWEKSLGLGPVTAGKGMKSA